MNNQRVMFSCTALQGTNKRGALTADEDGYYTVVLGGLNVYNSAGAYYPLDKAKALFEESSVFMRRVKSGCLKSECGHPKKSPAMTMRDYLNRIMQVEETNVCCHIAEVWLDHDNVKDENGRTVVAIMGKIRPSGPRGEALKDALENGRENVCFSIRSLTDDRIEGGVLTKHIKTILTFDWVTEPGISFAKKYHSPALESLTETVFTEEHFLLAEEYSNAHTGVGFESAGISFESLRDELGWTKKPQPMPASINW